VALFWIWRERFSPHSMRFVILGLGGLVDFTASCGAAIFGHDRLSGRSLGKSDQRTPLWLFTVLWWPVCLPWIAMLFIWPRLSPALKSFGGRASAGPAGNGSPMRWVSAWTGPANSGALFTRWRGSLLPADMCGASLWLQAFGRAADFFRNGFTCLMGWECLSAHHRRDTMTFSTLRAHRTCRIVRCEVPSDDYFPHEGAD